MTNYRPISFPTPRVGLIPPGLTPISRNSPLLPPAPPTSVAEIPGNRIPSATLEPGPMPPKIAVVPPAPPRSRLLGYLDYKERSQYGRQRENLRTVNRPSSLRPPLVINYNFPPDTPTASTPPTTDSTPVFGGGAPTDAFTASGTDAPIGFSTSSAIPLVVIGIVGLLAFRFLKKG